MKKIIRFHSLNAALLFSFVFAVCACAPQNTDGSGAAPASPVLKDAGGVDGSGGNIRSAGYETFERAVGRQAVHLRDLIHRLRLVKQDASTFGITSGTQVIWQSDSDLYAKLTAASPQQTDEIIARLKFKAQPTPCVSANHPVGDASFSGDTICYWYEAFKRFSTPDLDRQLAIITAHEYAHALNLTEEEAKSIQSNLSNDFQILEGNKLVLSGNKRFADFKEQFGLFAYGFIFDADLLIEQPKGWRNQLRDSATRDDNHITQMSRLNALPKYLDARFNDLIQPLQTSEVGKLSRAELSKKLLTKARNFEIFRKELLFYESPLCVEHVCDKSIASADGVIAKLESKMPWIENRKPFPNTDVSQVWCEVVDKDTKQILTVVDGEVHRSFVYRADRQDLNAYLSIISQSYENRKQSHATISLSITYSAMILAQDGFGNGGSREYEGFLQKGFKSKASMTIGILEDPFRDNDDQYEAMGGARVVWIRAAPKIKRVLEINCSLREN